MLHSPIAQVSTLLAGLVVVYALIAGRWPERLAAATLGVDWVGGILLQDHRAQHHLQHASFFLDVCQALVLLALVVKCRRAWTLWAGAFGVLLVLTHVTVLLDTRLTQWSYLTVSYTWSFGLLLAVGLGVAFEGRRPVAPLVWS